jgi:hypothetical protein
MSDRLPSGLLVGALLRRVNDAGGLGMVLARGDEQAGAILLILSEKGNNFRAMEAGIGPVGERQLIAAGPPDGSEAMAVSDYWQRRRARDPDLWVVELDIANAERFAAETIIAA